MPGCVTRCTDYRTDSIGNAWLDIRDHFGPRVNVGSSVYTTDISEWNVWAAANGKDPVVDIEVFAKWLIWKCSYGTTNYGNLPTRNRDHAGVSCIPCPLSSDNYDEGRSELWLGYIPSSGDLVVHGNHYMKVSQKGSSWGWECTYSGCSYLLNNGSPYFHV